MVDSFTNSSSQVMMTANKACIWILNEIFLHGWAQVIADVLVSTKVHQEATAIREKRILPRNQFNWWGDRNERWKLSIR